MPTPHDITAFFCLVDDFCSEIQPHIEQHLIKHGTIKRRRATGIHISEIVTLLIWFQVAGGRNFKSFYLNWAQPYLSDLFPNLPSYSRFIELAGRAKIYLFFLIESLKQPSSGIAFVDATALKVCHNKRIYSHKMFKDIAGRGKTSVDWFYGLKLHVVCDHVGRLVSYSLTAGHVDDRQALPQLCASGEILGKLFGDRGYLGKNWKQMMSDLGVDLITRLRRKMKPQTIDPFDEAVFRKRGIIECVFNRMKHIFEIEHSRHRSKSGLFNTILSTLVAYVLTTDEWDFGIQCLRPTPQKTA